MQKMLSFRPTLAALCFAALSPLTAQTLGGTVKILARFDYPHSFGTSADGINDAGDIVGNFDTKRLFYGYERFPDGTFQAIIDQPRQHDIEPSGINNFGIVCGRIGAFGFFYDGSVFTTYDMATSVQGINNAGDFVGYVVMEDVASGFVSIGGNFISIDIPGALYGTVASGINNEDEIVGYYYDSTGAHGFYRDPAGNLTYPIDVKNGLYTALHGINDSGEIVGEGETRSSDEGLVMRLPDQIISFEVSGAYITSAHGINNSNQICGTFIDFRGSTTHGFIAELRQ